MIIIENREELDTLFNEAVQRVNTHLEPFPADFLLRIYAYYKRAKNIETTSSENSKTIIDAFKSNALLQVNNINQDQAKQNYITLVNNYFLYRETKLNA